MRCKLDAGAAASLHRARRFPGGSTGVATIAIVQARGGGEECAVMPELPSWWLERTQADSGIEVPVISLRISKLGKLVSGREARAVFELLAQHGYLSEAGLAHPDAVMLVVQRVHDSWKADPPTGDEPWWHVQADLAAGGLLSPDGLAATREFVPRY